MIEIKLSIFDEASLMDKVRWMIGNSTDILEKICKI